MIFLVFKPGVPIYINLYKLFPFTQLYYLMFHSLQVVP